jgi:hypothetical protein
MNVKWIWRHPPSYLEGIFEETGRRIFTVDHPHPGIGVNYYHLNTDIKLLNELDHKNIEPFVKTVIGFANSYVSSISSLNETISPFIVISQQQLENPSWLPSTKDE